MRALVQRVKKASLKVNNELVSEIGEGLVCYLGVGKGDCDSDLKWLAKKVAGLRIFEDENGKMNLSALSQGFDIMVVSQFTLYGDIRNGYRPSFIEAENPDVANKKYEEFQQELKNLGIKNVGHGIFGADMYIEQENSGPVTIWLDSKQ